MKYKILNVSLVIVSGVAALFISSCASKPLTVPTPGEPNAINVNSDVDAKQYNSALVEAIQSADKIVIKEHSHKVDFFGTIVGLSDIPEYTYAQKELNTGEKVLFLDSVRKLKGVAVTSSTRCSFVPHHTIDFYEQGALKSSMQICYECSEIKWNGSKHIASKDVFQAISPAISRAGMKTHQEWGEMAKKRYELENKANPPKPKPGLTAKWAPGEKGKKVINPFTGKLVDVEGIPAGTKVRDPNDKDPTHVFRIPAM